MKEYASISANFAYFCNRLNDSNLIVDKDSAYAQYFLFGLIDSLPEGVEIEDAVVLEWQVGDFEALHLQIPAGIEHALMLELCSDDVLTLLAIKRS